jgi:pimeloyl-ACP methyl ester carboxylesterase
LGDATLSRCDMLWAVGAVTAGAVFAEPPKAAAADPSGAGREPTSWVDSAMPEVTHRMIETNGIRLRVAEQGEGLLIIHCHGFPECWYSWRHQLGALAKAGFRAVAPDLRGYGRSDRPEEVEKYTILHDIDDIVGLVDALGAQQSVIAGHDVGATMAWQAALLRPDRFRAVIALGVPFRPRAFGGSVPPTTFMPRNEDAVFYQLFLQTPEVGWTHRDPQGGSRPRRDPATDESRRLLTQPAIRGGLFLASKTGLILDSAPDHARRAE